MEQSLDDPVYPAETESGSVLIKLFIIRLLNDLKIVKFVNNCVNKQQCFLVPTIETILRLPSTMEDTSNALQPQESQLNTSFNLDDIDDEELDSYIMSEKECEVKKDLWHVQNADYLKKQTGKF